MSQVNVIVIHVRAKQAAEYEKLFVERQLPRWRDYQQRGKFISARFFRSQFGSEEQKSVVKYVIVVEVPSRTEDHEHDSDPVFEWVDRQAEALRPAGARV